MSQPIATTTELIAILRDTELANRRTAALDIPASDEVALCLEVSPPNALRSWELLRSLVDTTGRWPVLVATFDNRGGWEGFLDDRDFVFSRFPYKNDCNDPSIDVSPSAILANADALGLETVLAEFAERDNWNQGLNTDDLGRAIEQTQERFGIAPNRAEIERDLDLETSNPTDLEHWLFNWEFEHGDRETFLAAPDLQYLSWFEPKEWQGLALVLLPTTNDSNALAYISWYGAEGAGEAEKVILLLRSWKRRFGIELVAHHSTMLQFLVDRKPSTPDEAFQLACEQERIAPCTILLPGVSLRDHARALLHCDRWFLHERP